MDIHSFPGYLLRGVLNKPTSVLKCGLLTRLDGKIWVTYHHAVEGAFIELESLWFFVNAFRGPTSPGLYPTGKARQAPPDDSIFSL
jgi:hypothetical protein